MIFRSLACHRKGAVLGKCSFSMNVFQVDTQFIATAYSQPMYLVQTEPELTVQIAKTLFCNDPKRGRNQQSHLASSETLSNLDFVHSTDLVTGLVDFSACSSCKLKTK